MRVLLFAAIAGTAFGIEVGDLYTTALPTSSLDPTIHILPLGCASDYCSNTCYTGGEMPELCDPAVGHNGFPCSDGTETYPEPVMGFQFGSTTYFCGGTGSGEVYCSDCNPEGAEGVVATPPETFVEAQAELGIVTPGAEPVNIAKAFSAKDDTETEYKVGKYQLGGKQYKAKDYDNEGSGHGDTIIQSTVPANDAEGQPIPYGEWDGINTETIDGVLFCQVSYNIEHDATLSSLLGDTFECEETEIVRRRAVLEIFERSGYQMDKDALHAYYKAL